MTVNASRDHPVRLAILLAASLFVLTGYVRSAPAGPLAAAVTPGRSEAEQWVVSQVEAGQNADLEQHFPDDENKRVLHADFLRQLLTGLIVPVEKSHRFGLRLTGAILDEPLDLSNDLVGCSVQLQHCRFQRDVRFNRTVFADAVAFSRSEFLGAASFHAAKIGGNAYFDETKFSGEANLSDLSVVGYFMADKAQFLSPDKLASFSGAKIGSFVSLDSAVFNGPTNFYELDVTGVFAANGIRFQNKDRSAIFIGLKVGAAARFTNALFAGDTSFADAQIADVFSLNNSQFTAPDKAASFVNLKAAHNVSLVHTVFAGSVDFNSSEVGTFLIANDARFESHDKTAGFLAMKVGATAYFVGTVFSGPVNLGDSNFLSLYIAAPTLPAEAIPMLGLVNTTVKQDLHLEHLHIRDLVASSLRVEGSTVFDGVQVDHEADFSYCNFANLYLGGSKWPDLKTGELLLRGTNYKYVQAAPDEVESHEKLLALVDQAAYTADVYANLGAFFLRQGYKEDADRVYVASQTRERRDHMSRLSFRYYWNCVLQGIGYGRYPERALYACLLVVALGCWLFQPAKMQRQANEDGKRAFHYNRFWYSLELFLPLMELKAADAWEPKPNERFLRHYMRIHTLLGWVLIPIGLASVTGVIK